MMDNSNSSEFIAEYADLVEEHGNLAGILGIDKQQIDDWYREGIEAYGNGDYAKASRCFTYLTFLNPQSGDLQLACGSALQQMGEYADALEHFTAATELLPNDPGGWFRQAECEVALSRCDEARETLRRCLALCTSDTGRAGLYPHAKALMDQLL